MQFFIENLISLSTVQKNHKLYLPQASKSSTIINELPSPYPSPYFIGRGKSRRKIYMKILWHFLTLLASFLFIFIWEQTLLADFTIQLLGVLVFLYLLLTIIRRKKKQINNFGGMSDIFLLNTALFLLISLTGNLYSPLFFLLYFLGFGITFIFEPAAVFIFTIGAVCIFLPEILKNLALESFLRIGSLVLIAPLAFFFGASYKDRDKEEAQVDALQERTKDAADTIAKDVETVIKDGKDKLGTKDVEKLNEILEESEQLREESKEE